MSGTPDRCSRCDTSNPELIRQLKGALLKQLRVETGKLYLSCKHATLCKDCFKVMGDKYPEVYTPKKVTMAAKLQICNKKKIPSPVSLNQHGDHVVNKVGECKLAKSRREEDTIRKELYEKSQQLVTVGGGDILMLYRSSANKVYCHSNNEDWKKCIISNTILNPQGKNPEKFEHGLNAISVKKERQDLSSLRALPIEGQTVSDSETESEVESNIFIENITKGTSSTIYETPLSTNVSRKRKRDIPSAACPIANESISDMGMNFLQGDMSTSAKFQKIQGTNSPAINSEKTVIYFVNLPNVTDASVAMNNNLKGNELLKSLDEGVKDTVNKLVKETLNQSATTHDTTVEDLGQSGEDCPVDHSADDSLGSVNDQTKPMGDETIDTIQKKLANRDWKGRRPPPFTRGPIVNKFVEDRMLRMKRELGRRKTLLDKLQELEISCGGKILAIMRSLSNQLYCYSSSEEWKNYAVSNKLFNPNGKRAKSFVPQTRAFLRKREKVRNLLSESEPPLENPNSTLTWKKKLQNFALNVKYIECRKKRFATEGQRRRTLGQKSNEIVTMCGGNMLVFYVSQMEHGTQTFLYSNNDDWENDAISSKILNPQGETPVGLGLVPCLTEEMIVQKPCFLGTPTAEGPSANVIRYQRKSGTSSIVTQEKSSSGNINIDATTIHETPSHSTKSPGTVYVPNTVKMLNTTSKEQEFLVDMEGLDNEVSSAVDQLLKSTLSETFMPDGTTISDDIEKIGDVCTPHVPQISHSIEIATTDKQPEKSGEQHGPKIVLETNLDAKYCSSMKADQPPDDRQNSLVNVFKCEAERSKKERAKRKKVHHKALDLVSMCGGDVLAIMKSYTGMIYCFSSVTTWKADVLSNKLFNPKGKRPQPFSYGPDVLKPDYNNRGISRKSIPQCQGSSESEDEDDSKSRKKKRPFVPRLPRHKYIEDNRQRNSKEIKVRQFMHNLIQELTRECGGDILVVFKSPTSLVYIFSNNDDWLNYALFSQTLNPQGKPMTPRAANISLLSKRSKQLVDPSRVISKSSTNNKSNTDIVDVEAKDRNSAAVPVSCVAKAKDRKMQVRGKNNRRKKPQKKSVPQTSKPALSKTSKQIVSLIPVDPSRAISKSSTNRKSNTDIGDVEAMDQESAAVPAAAKGQKLQLQKSVPETSKPALSEKSKQIVSLIPVDPSRAISKSSTNRKSNIDLCDVEAMDQESAAVPATAKGQKLQLKGKKLKKKMQPEKKSTQQKSEPTKEDQNKKTELVSEAISIPKIYHPFINGPDNKVVHGLMEHTGSYISVPSRLVMEDVVVVTGETNSVSQAKASLMSIYEEKLKCAAVCVEIQKSKHKCIIGPLGSNLNKILEITGVAVDVPLPDCTSDTITLRGDQGNLGGALTLIYALIE